MRHLPPATRQITHLFVTALKPCNQHAGLRLFRFHAATSEDGLYHDPLVLTLTVPPPLNAATVPE